MKRATLIALAAAVLSAKMAGAVGFTGEEIDRLDDLVDRQDVAAIQAFASGKPALSPDDPLGALLLTIFRRHKISGVNLAKRGCKRLTDCLPLRRVRASFNICVSDGRGSRMMKASKPPFGSLRGGSSIQLPRFAGARDWHLSRRIQIYLHPQISCE